MYTKDNPFIALVKQRESLCKEGSSKETLHLVLDLKGLELPYKVGDSVAIFPRNVVSLVLRTLEALKLSGDEIIIDPKTGHSLMLREFLYSKGSITRFSRSFLNEVLTRAQKNVDDPKKVVEEHHVWDFLEAHPEVSFSAQEVVNLLMPLMPRFYSIASSPLVHPNEIHLTLVHTKYETRSLERVGVCTEYLCKTIEVGSEIELYVHPSHNFFLTENKEQSIIMIGPGTGVAPFRAFMQEREFTQASGKNWLFFGERTRANEFFYEDEWARWVSMGLLQIDFAFSRDQEEKIYVQHRLKEKSSELMKWLEEGAMIYVCGDAQHMAKDVNNTLLDIIREQSSHDPAEYLKHLKKEGRYLRDVY